MVCCLFPLLNDIFFWSRQRESLFPAETYQPFSLVRLSLFRDGVGLFAIVNYHERKDLVGVLLFCEVLVPTWLVYHHFTLTLICSFAVMKLNALSCQVLRNASHIKKVRWSRDGHAKWPQKQSPLGKTCLVNYRYHPKLPTDPQFFLMLNVIFFSWWPFNT